MIDDANTFPLESVTVRDGPGGTTTSIDVVGGQIATLGGAGLFLEASTVASVSGGIIAYLGVSGDSHVTLSGGQVGRAIATGNSALAISGGRVQELITSDFVTIDMTGGVIADNSAVEADSIFTMYAGTFESVLEFDGRSMANIYGGSFGFGPQVRKQSVAHIFGGSIGSSLLAAIGAEEARMFIYGNGFNFPFGELPAGLGMLNGVLSDGTPIDTDYFVGTGGRITLVMPEPRTGLLLVLGLTSLALLRERTPRRVLPHSTLNNLTPAEYARRLSTERSDQAIF